MYQKFKQSGRQKKSKFFPVRVEPTSIDWHTGGQQATFTFSDGGKAVGSCIHCENPPCMEYKDEELEVPMFPDFPADLNREVCPSGAIKWPIESESPVVNPDLCFACGLCLKRCPVSAISFSTELVAVVNDVPNEYFRDQPSKEVELFNDDLTEIFSKTHSKGRFLRESDSVMTTILAKAQKIADDNKTGQFPNHLARNLLMAIGNSCAMRRLGDTNVRMDLVMNTPTQERGIGEVEFGTDMLDAPRNILDSTAVLIARYNTDKDALIPVIVCMYLPNHRAEYWQVIRDISQVLQINIQSITFGVLFVLLWNQVIADFSRNSNFYIDSEASSIRPRVKALLDRELNISEGHEGLMESPK